MSSEESRRRRDFRKYAVDDVAGVLEKLLKAREGKERKGTKVGDKEAEDFVSCVECCLLYGLRGSQARAGSFWGFILETAQANKRLKAFQDDVEFCKSLYFEDDPSGVERGRAWLRQCLNAGRVGFALRVLAVTPTVISRWTNAYSVWQSRENASRLLLHLKKASGLSFELQMYHSVRYKWKIEDGFPTRVYCNPKPPPTPSGGQKPQARSAQQQSKPAAAKRSGGLFSGLYDMVMGTQRAQPGKPTPWIAYTDESTGCMYFYNAATNQSTWEEPEQGYVTHESAANFSPGFITVGREGDSDGVVAQGDAKAAAAEATDDDDDGKNRAAEGDIKTDVAADDASSVGALEVRITDPSGETKSASSTAGASTGAAAGGGQKATAGGTGATTRTAWIRFVDEDTKCTYYFNATTGETKWDEPVEGFLTDESALDWQNVVTQTPLITPSR